MIKNAEIAAATDGPDVSYGNLLNPISQFFSGKDKYPAFMLNMFPNHPEAAWMTSKMGAAALLAACIFGGARYIQHVNNISNIAEEDDPAKKMKSQLGTTYAVNLDDTKVKKATMSKKAGDDLDSYYENAVPSGGSLDLSVNTRRVALPLASFLLSAALSWKGVDYLADKRRNAILTETTDNKSRTVRRLIKARAQLARGTISDSELNNVLDSVQNDENFVKTGGLFSDLVKRGLTGLGLLALALGVTSSVSAYNYFSKSDEDNIKYKAMERGLNEYAKQKTSMTPVSTLPLDSSEYFSDIDGTDGKKKRTARETREIDATRKPLEVTL